MRQAMDNWTYFFDDMALDPVGRGAERTTLWNSHPDGFVDHYRVTNTAQYTGFLLYARVSRAASCAPAAARPMSARCRRPAVKRCRCAARDRCRSNSRVSATGPAGSYRKAPTMPAMRGGALPTCYIPRSTKPAMP